MNNQKINGSCLCGKVKFQISGPFKIFQYCYCSRCRKLTGSAFSPNIFVPPERFNWTAGEESVGRYELPDAKYFTSCFCKQCGSTLPWAVKGGKNIVVPAGTLDDDPGIEPFQNIFWGSKAPWFKEPDTLECHDEFPGK